MRLRLVDSKPLLLADKALCHPAVPLGKIELVFLPENTTAMQQPCDNGIIRNLKGFHHTVLQNRILATLEAGDGSPSTPTASNLARKVFVLDAVHMVAKAWSTVNPATISNCFRKALSQEEEEDKGVPQADPGCATSTWGESRGAGGHPGRRRCSSPG